MALKTLREKRIKQEAFDESEINDLSGEALVRFIREERQRELCLEGHRWFDLRRYAVNSIHPLPDNFSIRHRNNAYEANSQTWYENGYYKLNAYTQDRAAWVIPIPNYAIEFNRENFRTRSARIENFKEIDYEKE